MPTDADRRRSPRAPVSTQVVQIEAGDGQVDITLGHTRDVSLHGMYVEVKVQFNPAQDRQQDEKMSVRFKLPGLEETVEAEGRIARVDRTEDDGTITGFGVEFIGLSKESRRVIETFVQAAPTLE